ncbi:MAG: hypothetical protein IKH07_07450, partial [Oscillospiraceae bacterium]|nr:hypothetical protein [Oscillospiraceae bacterium]
VKILAKQAGSAQTAQKIADPLRNETGIAGFKYGSLILTVTVFFDSLKKRCAAAQRFFHGFRLANTDFSECLPLGGKVA